MAERRVRVREALSSRPDHAQPKLLRLELLQRIAPKLAEQALAAIARERAARIAPVTTDELAAAHAFIAEPESPAGNEKGRLAFRHVMTKLVREYGGFRTTALGLIARLMTGAGDGRRLQTSGSVTAPGSPARGHLSPIFTRLSEAVEPFAKAFGVTPNNATHAWRAKVNSLRGHCPKCKYRSRYNKVIANHMRLNHPKLVERLARQAMRAAPKGYVCPKCNAPIKSGHAIASHMMTKHGPKNLRCGVGRCRRVFANRGARGGHWAKSHREWWAKKKAARG